MSFRSRDFAHKEHDVVIGDDFHLSRVDTDLTKQRAFYFRREPSVIGALKVGSGAGNLGLVIDAGNARNFGGDGGSQLLQFIGLCLPGDERDTIKGVQGKVRASFEVIVARNQVTCSLVGMAIGEHRADVAFVI